MSFGMPVRKNPANRQARMGYGEYTQLALNLQSGFNRNMQNLSLVCRVAQPKMQFVEGRMTA
jgi:hypothetical protein